jgi:hypothetical protein
LDLLDPLDLLYHDEMAINVYVIESEEPKSKTSVRKIYNNICADLRTVGMLGESDFIDAPNVVELIAAADKFETWTKILPATEPILLWPSIHGGDPEYGTDDVKRKLVGTSGVDINGNEVEWYKFFAPIKRATEPGRIVIVLDVCWGTSPTVAAVLTTPADRRPAMIFGPSRNSNRSELDVATKMIVDQLTQHGIPDVSSAKKLVDDLNVKFPPATASGTPFYRVWYWGVAGAQSYPAIVKGKIH